MNNLSGGTVIAINLKAIKDLDLSSPADTIVINGGQQWTWGTGANQVNSYFHDQRSLADGANETLDIYASGSLTNAFGEALTMAAIKLLYIKNNSADATLKVFGGASVDVPILADTSDILEIPPGGDFLWTCPTAAGLVTSTNKNIKLEHDGTGDDALLYDILILGLD